VSEDRTTRGWELLAGVAVLAGVFWAIIQFVLTSVGMEQTHAELVACGVDASKRAIWRVTLGACVAAFIAFVAAVSRRPRVALALIGVEAILALVWSAVEGGAASCAIE
jgi:hypothetical protein